MSGGSTRKSESSWPTAIPLLAEGNNILDESSSIGYDFVMVKKPKTLKDAIEYFSDLQNCVDYLAAKRWPDGIVTCPTCGRENPTYLKNQAPGKWQCTAKHSMRQFTIKTGTIFEDSPISID